MAEEKKTQIDPFKDYVNVFIPKDYMGDDDVQFVSINDRTFTVRKNEDVMVPRPVAYVLRQRNSAIKVTERAIQTAQEKVNKQP